MMVLITLVDAQSINLVFKSHHKSVLLARCVCLYSGLVIGLLLSNTTSSSIHSNRFLFCVITLWIPHGIRIMIFLPHVL